MEITKDEDAYTAEKDFYSEFDQAQLIAKLAIDEKVKIEILDKDGKSLFSKEYPAKYINCHFNFLWQDKGIKSEESLYEYVKTLKT